MHRVGKLRAGVKKSSTRDGKAVSYPSAVDYFVVNEDSSTSAQSAAGFHARYGAEPRELDVVLPAHLPGEVLEGAWRLYGTGGLLKRKCEGPGGQCVQRGPAGEWISGGCACDSERIPLDSREHCAERWTLSVLLMDVPGVGVWQFDTGSSMAARDMAGMLSFIHSWRGSLLRAECKLRLVPRQVSPKGVAKTVYIAQLDASGTTPAEALAMAEDGGPALALPPSTLDEAPDPLLDGVIDVVALPSPPPPPPPPTRPAPPSTGEPEAVGVQIKAMSAMERAELYRLAGIPKGSASTLVRGMLSAAWAELGLPDYDKEPDLAVLLRALLDRAQAKASEPVAREAFAHLVQTGEDISPGDQTVIS